MVSPIQCSASHNGLSVLDKINISEIQEVYKALEFAQKDYCLHMMACLLQGIDEAKQGGLKSPSILSELGLGEMKEKHSAFVALQKKYEVLKTNYLLQRVEELNAKRQIARKPLLKA